MLALAVGIAIVSDCAARTALQGHCLALAALGASHSPARKDALKIKSYNKSKYYPERRLAEIRK